MDRYSPKSRPPRVAKVTERPSSRNTEEPHRGNSLNLGCGGIAGCLNFERNISRGIRYHINTPEYLGQRPRGLAADLTNPREDNRLVSGSLPHGQQLSLLRPEQ